MRKIDKGNPMPSFSEFISKNHPTKWEDAKEVRRIWREYILMYEQHWYVRLWPPRALQVWSNNF